MGILKSPEKGVFCLDSVVRFHWTSIVLILLTIGQTCFGQSGFRMPNHYTSHRTLGEIIVDGKGDDESWQKTQWTNYFTDIEGAKKPSPYLATRIKMLWDEEYFYFYASMQEPHIWAKLTQRDAVIFHDNDFEIFIDPDGDTHNYLEFEVNAFNTVWDLLLTRPYRDGGNAINAWDIKGLKSAVHVDGTINDPSDTDKGWSVEVAIPWKVIKEVTRTTVPPKNGHQWRLNFSRVQWETEVIDGKYVKKKSAETGKNLSENNWVWSPQRAIAMHEPEFWGMVSFSTQPVGGPRTSIGRNQEAEEIRQILYQVHRAQVNYRRRNRSYSMNLSDLNLEAPKKTNGLEVRVEINTFSQSEKYEASVFLLNKGWWRIDDTGRIWFQKSQN